MEARRVKVVILLMYVKCVWGASKQKTCLGPVILTVIEVFLFSLHGVYIIQVLLEYPLLGGWSAFRMSFIARI